MKKIFTSTIFAAVIILYCSLQTIAQNNDPNFNITWAFDGNLSGVSSHTNIQSPNAQVSSPLTITGYEQLEGTNQAVITSGWSSDTIPGPNYIEVQFTPTEKNYLLNGVNARVKRSGGGPSQVRVTYTITKRNSTEDSLTFDLSTANLTTEDYTDIFISTQYAVRTLTTAKIRYYGLSAPGPVNNLNVDYIRASGMELDILPVTITYFRAQTIGNSVSLNWETAWERNSREFIIQRSSDLKEWGDIASIPAAGESDGRRQYSYADPNPMMGINYYRLRMVDLDNTYEYSQPKDAIYRPEQPQLIVSPNPVAANEAITIRTWNIDANTLRLTSLLGQNIPFRLHKVSNDSWEVRPGSPLASGFYFITADQPGEPLTVRVMVP